MTSVGLFRAPAELPSFSMDRYAESLRAALEAARADLAVDDVRLPAHRRPARTRLGTYVRRYPAAAAHARRTRFDVNHVMDHAYAHLCFVLDPRRTIVTCHDIFPIKHRRGEVPGLPRRRVPPVTVQLSLAGLRRARYVVTPSEATKADVVRHVGVDETRIHVIPYGIDDSFRPGGGGGDRFGLNSGAKVVLSVDSGPPYKNTNGVLRTFARVVARADAQVVLARAGPRLTPADQAYVREAGLQERVVELGAVPREEMHALYGAADVLLFPSLYEGFGWPPLEAMACGVPVVTSTWASLAEVVGDAAPTAPATDHEALATHVVRLLEDEGARADAIRRGLARAERFSWRKNAETTAALYDTITGGG